MSPRSSLANSLPPFGRSMTGTDPRRPPRRHHFVDRQRMHERIAFELALLHLEALALVRLPHRRDADIPVNGHLKPSPRQLVSKRL